MNEEEIGALSINHERSKISLEETRKEKFTDAIKALVGDIPGIGSTMQEIFTYIIPDLRADKVKTLLEVLGMKITQLESDMTERMTSKEFCELLQDAVPQAARALSKERLEYIASFLKNSLTEEELNVEQEKKILSLLGELNDAEIIILRYESLRQPEREAFLTQHAHILRPPRSFIGSPRADHDKAALYSSFREKLFELGLMKKEYKKVAPGVAPEFDEKTGTLKHQSTSLTQLGRLLLRRIDQPAAQDRQADDFEARKRENEAG